MWIWIRIWCVLKIHTADPRLATTPNLQASLLKTKKKKKNRAIDFAKLEVEAQTLAAQATDPPLQNHVPEVVSSDVAGEVMVTIPLFPTDDCAQ